MAATVPLPSPDEPGTSAHPLTPAPLDRRWRRSSFSTGAEATCGEVTFGDPADPADGDPAPDAPTVLVRHSQDPGGPVLRFTFPEWRAFLRGVGAGEFELP